MLFKLISNGKNTVIELDGQEVYGMSGISFRHEVDQQGKKSCKVALEFDITANTAKEAADKHLFEAAKKGEFCERVALWERMFEDPETKGQEPPETQRIIDMMKAAEACEAPAAKAD